MSNFDAERLQVEVLLLAQRLHGEARASRRGRRPPRRPDAAPTYRSAISRDVLAVIPALGNLERRRRRARARAPATLAREILDLHAGVVVVELARHLPAGPLEQRADRVAERGLAAVADVQRAGGIRAHELDDHRLARAASSGRTRRRRATSAVMPLRHGARVEPEVDEARAGDLRARHAGGVAGRSRRSAPARCRAASGRAAWRAPSRCSSPSRRTRDRAGARAAARRRRARRGRARRARSRAQCVVASAHSRARLAAPASPASRQRASRRPWACALACGLAASPTSPGLAADLPSPPGFASLDDAPPSPRPPPSRRPSRRRRRARRRRPASRRCPSRDARSCRSR